MKYIFITFLAFFILQGCSSKEEVIKSQYKHDVQKENAAFKELDEETKK